MRVKDVSKKRSMASLAVIILMLSGVARTAFAQNQAPAGTLKVEPEVMEKRCITKVNPIFPQIVRQSRMQGTVTLRVLISKTGSVTPLTFVSGPPLLQDAAKSTVRKWEYKPYLVNGQPVAVTTEVSVLFRLDATEGAVTHPNQ